MPIGTKVRLASGGPVMLVVDRDLMGVNALCAWRMNDGSIEECWFPSICLDVIRKMHIVDR